MFGFGKKKNDGVINSSENTPEKKIGEYPEDSFIKISGEIPVEEGFQFRDPFEALKEQEEEEEFTVISGEIPVEEGFHFRDPFEALKEQEEEDEFTRISGEIPVEEGFQFHDPFEGMKQPVQQKETMSDNEEMLRFIKENSDKEMSIAGIVRDMVSKLRQAGLMKSISENNYIEMVDSLELEQTKVLIEWLTMDKTELQNALAEALKMNEELKQKLRDEQSHSSTPLREFEVYGVIDNEPEIINLNNDLEVCRLKVVTSEGAVICNGWNECARDLVGNYHKGDKIYLKGTGGEVNITEIKL